jgi:hypothetical protein
MMRLVSSDTPRQMFVQDRGYLEEHQEQLERVLA